VRSAAEGGLDDPKQPAKAPVEEDCSTAPCASDVSLKRLDDRLGQILNQAFAEALETRHKEFRARTTDDLPTANSGDVAGLLSAGAHTLEGVLAAFGMSAGISKEWLDAKFQREGQARQAWLEEVVATLRSEVQERVEHLRREFSAVSLQVHKVFPSAMAQAASGGEVSLSDARWLSIDVRLKDIEEQRWQLAKEQLALRTQLEKVEKRSSERGERQAALPQGHCRTLISEGSVPDAAAWRRSKAEPKVGTTTAFDGDDLIATMAVLGVTPYHTAKGLQQQTSSSASSPRPASAPDGRTLAVDSAALLADGIKGCRLAMAGGDRGALPPSLAHAARDDVMECHGNPGAPQAVPLGLCDSPSPLLIQQCRGERTARTLAAAPQDISHAESPPPQSPTGCAESVQGSCAAPQVTTLEAADSQCGANSIEAELGAFIDARFWRHADSTGGENAGQEAELALAAEESKADVPDSCQPGSARATEPQGRRTWLATSSAGLQHAAGNALPEPGVTLSSLVADKVTAELGFCHMPQYDAYGKVLPPVRRPTSALDARSKKAATGRPRSAIAYALPANRRAHEATGASSRPKPALMVNGGPPVTS